MSENFPNRQTIRLRGFDYSTQALYFVTICTHNRKNLLGEIKNGKMVLNDVGNIVQFVWESLPKHHNVTLDCFQIMPNHVHFNILLMGGLKNKTGGSRLNKTGGLEIGSGGSRPAPTLGMMVGFLKSESTKQIRKTVGATRGSPETRGRPDGGLPVWQRNYYEHIIRSESEYDKICYYIINNPKNWNQDKNNLANNAS